MKLFWPLTGKCAPAVQLMMVFLQGDTALHIACRGGHSALVKTLLSHDAEAETVNKQVQSWHEHLSACSSSAHSLCRQLRIRPAPDLQLGVKAREITCVAAASCTYNYKSDNAFFLGCISEHC